MQGAILYRIAMLNALDNLPEDPVELRRVTELLASEVKAQALMIEKLQHQLHGANRHRFGSKSEGMDQLQLFAENEEIAEAAVNGGVKSCHWGGAKVGQFGGRALERVALI